jgi:hypothetical protein
LQIIENNGKNIELKNETNRGVIRLSEVSTWLSNVGYGHEKSGYLLFSVLLLIYNLEENP